LNIPGFIRPACAFDGLEPMIRWTSVPTKGFDPLLPASTLFPASTWLRIPLATLELRFGVTFRLMAELPPAFMTREPLIMLEMDDRPR
jgi:hypothetical protein